MKALRNWILIITMFACVTSCNHMRHIEEILSEARAPISVGE